MTMADKVRAILMERQITQGQLAAELDVSQPTVARWLAGADPEQRRRKLLEEMYENEVLRKTYVVYLSGYVWHGQAIVPVDPEKAEMVTACQGANGFTKAAIVEGDAMMPLFGDGWTIYWSHPMEPGELLNSLCVIETEDGNLYVKTLRRGSGDGLFTLTSPSSTDIIDAKVSACFPIDWVRPRYAYARINLP